MKIIESVCKDCKYFEHECNSNSEFVCDEFCTHDSTEIQDYFFDNEIIKECNGFKTR